jgi:hypothetical protein
MATYKGSCHCGRISFNVEGEIGQVIECNCSHCSRKGYLFWFQPRQNVTLNSSILDVSTYTFNTHKIKHHFCPVCGCAPFGFGTDPNGNETAAINVRCLAGVEPSTLNIVPVDGRRH